MDKDTIDYFVRGALDKDFSVSQPGAYVATKGKVRIIFRHEGFYPWITIYIGRQKVKEMPDAVFFWNDITLIKGKLYYRDEFLK